MLRIAGDALHRVRDTRLLTAQAPRVPDATQHEVMRR